MPELIEPSPRVHESFLAAMNDFAAEGRGGPGGTDSALGRNISLYAASWASASGFAAFLQVLHDEGDPAMPPPSNFVHSSTFWWVDGADFLGEIRIRPTLNPRLLEIGGHIGYDVAPAARLKGHGTAMLAAALPRAATLGIASALVTCDSDNIGSVKIIEANGGRLEGTRLGKLRYWVPTALTAQGPVTSSV